ncbi:MAG: hypothetical protein J1G38_00185 [Clostridiales bacterium]|nr:hypothetical protein [Clostridiales bacterium]
MKLKVVGWTSYSTDLECGVNGWAARNAIIDEIKKKGYLFSGWVHQEGYCCAPVLNDGKVRCYSQRGWGGIMAEAHGKTGRMAYVSYSFISDAAKEIRPDDSFDEDKYIPEPDLSERFEVSVSRDKLEASRNKRKIKLDDLPELRYMDAGDTLALLADGEVLEFAVVDVDRQRDFSPAKLLRLEMDFYDSDTQKSKRAEEEFNNGKIIIVATVKKPRPQKK